MKKTGAGSAAMHAGHWMYTSAFCLQKGTYSFAGGSAGAGKLVPRKYETTYYLRPAGDDLSR